MSDFSFNPSTFVVIIPGTNKSTAFTPNTSEVFKEEHNIAPVFITEKMQYIPWGADNQMPYNIIVAIEFSILRTDEYPIPSIIDTVNLTAHPPPTYSVNGRLPTLQRSSKATDIKIKREQVGISSEILL